MGESRFANCQTMGAGQLPLPDHRVAPIFGPMGGCRATIGVNGRIILTCFTLVGVAATAATAIEGMYGFALAVYGATVVGLLLLLRRGALAVDRQDAARSLDGRAEATPTDAILRTVSERPQVPPRAG